MLRRVVYTVLYGQQNALVELPVRRDSAIDFIAFVDDPTLRSDTWTIRHLPPLLPTDIIRSSRFPKICAHRVLPDYDVSLYIDTKVRLTARPEEIFADLLEGQTSTMACLRHDSRATIDDEAEAIIGLGLDRADICRAQLAAYRRDGFAGTVPLTWSGMLLRYHHEPIVRETMERWFAQVLRYSRRDQISFPYVAEKSGLGFVAHPFSNRETKWHQWPVAPSHVRDGYWESAIEGLDLQQKTLAEAERLVAALRAEIDALRHSTSWQMTAPLRWASGLLKRRLAGSEVSANAAQTAFRYPRA